ncbi:HIRAN domain-containing protein [Aeribacillus sp. FSL K6-8394]|uniref:HIRAN domain-containing protein n=1 Tax=Aeribacillus sp. FSL K6-8394 TaxID=2954570 RepID=UPI0030F8917A
MTRPFVLWFIWQNERMCQRYHIGNLVHHEGKYVFYYEKSRKRRGLLDALENGYQPHLAFRDIDKIYVSDRLFGPFERRLPDRRRPDFPEILRTHGLSSDYTEMDLLRATGGRLATDSYEFVAPIYVYGNHFDFDFYIAGWRYYEGEQILKQLKIGEKVQFQLEPENEQDPKAVIVLTSQGRKLGYIPAFYSEFMFQLMENDGDYEAKIHSIHFKALPQLKVNISVCGKLLPPLKERNLNMVYDLQLEMI